MPENKTSTHPNKITIEIDRPRLRRYLCANALFPCLILFFIFGVPLSIAPVADTLDHGVFATKMDATLLLFGTLAKGVAISQLLALAYYFLFRHRATLRAADNLEITIEGPFLHIREYKSARMDRKLHFRSIVDYATMDGPLMRFFGISALQMTTTGGGLNSTITLPGVKNCLAVRDLLSEIDSQRELS